MKKIKELLKNNAGFSLTELIIVLAIIVIMTGASFITLSVMHSAKAKEAASSFETELAMASSDAKNKSVDLDVNGTIDDYEKENYFPGLRIYEGADNKLYLQKYVMVRVPNALQFVRVEMFDTHPYIQSVNVGNGKGVCLSAYVDVTYTDKNGNKTEIKGTDEVVVAFNKKGECISGVGIYDFIKKDGSTVATIRVNPNGSYHVD